jgi:hypothetical protein
MTKVEDESINEFYFPKHKFLINNDSNLQIGKNHLLVKDSFSITSPDCNECIISLIDEKGKNIPKSNNKYDLPNGMNKVGLYIQKETSVNSKKDTAWYDFQWFEIKVEKNPYLIKSSLSALTVNSARVDGSIENYVFGNIISYGLCYSNTSILPTVDDNKVEFFPDNILVYTKEFSVALTNLPSTTRYYTRVYIITDGGVIYGNVLKFTTFTAGTTVAGGNGRGSAANQLSLPTVIYVNSQGATYVGDHGNNRIQKFAPNSTSQNSGITVAGGVTSGSLANRFIIPWACT